MTLQRTYKVAEIIAAAGMSRNEFAYCRRKLGIQARGRGCKSEYTLKETRRIISAFHSLFEPRPVDPARIEELKQDIRNNGY